MKNHVREAWCRAIAAASVSLLLVLPTLTSAALFINSHDAPLATRIFDRVIERLCKAQEARRNRVILIDPSRCAPPAPPPLGVPTLTLWKTVVNDNGGIATTTDFQAKIDDVNVPWGVPQPVSVGAHVASETTLAGYSASNWSGNCATDGTITLAAGEHKVCSIINDDNPPHIEGKLLITEVLYDLGPGQGTEPANEWVEIHNGMSSDINLAGYFIHDASSSFDPLPSMLLPAGKFAVITGATTTPTFWSIPADAVLVVLTNSTIGNGLGNASDVVFLTNPASTTIDAVSWGANTSAFTPAAPDVAAGHSLARTPLTTDTDTAADWADRSAPTPGS